MRIAGYLLIIAVFAGTVDVLAAEKETMSVDAAIKAICQRNALRKSEVLRKKVVRAFAGLEKAEADAAYDKLMAAMPRYDGHAMRTVVRVFEEMGRTEDVLDWFVAEGYKPSVTFMCYFGDKLLPRLLKGFSRKKAAVREQAAFVLYNMASTQWRYRMRNSQALANAVPEVAKLLQDSSPNVVVYAARLLPLMGGEARKYLPQLTAALEADDLMVQVAATESVARLGGDEKSAGKLADLLSSPRMAARIAAAEALEQWRGKAASASAALAEAMRDEKASVLSRARAMDAYLAVAISGQARSKLNKKEALEAEDKETVDKAVSQLAGLLSAESDVLAVRAGSHLAGLGAVALPALQEKLKGKDARARRFAAFAAAKMGAAGAAAAEDLAGLLTDGNAKVRRNAAEALGAAGAAGRAKVILPLLDDDELPVALAAEKALQKLAPEDAEVSAALRAFGKKLEARNVSEPDKSDIGNFNEDAYLIGGPLAGIELPLFPTQHGEPAGYPGCIGKLAEKAQKEREQAIEAGEEEKPYGPLNAPFTPVGQNPEHQLYDGSVEHWRAYMMKYLPMRSLFDKQSLRRNWVAPNIPGATRKQADEFAEPIRWTPRWGISRPTGFYMEPVPVVRWGEGDKPFTLNCGELQHGTYAVRIVAAVDEEQVEAFRRPLVIRMTVDNGLEGEPSEYIKRVNYVSEFYGMCEMFFPAPETREYKVTLSVHEDSDDELKLLVHNITLDDCLSGVDRRAIKTRMTLHRPEDLGFGKQPDERSRRRRPALLAEERAIRDRWLWRQFPQPNSQIGSSEYRLWSRIRRGVPGTGNLKARYGSWKVLVNLRKQGAPFGKTPDDPNVFLYNDKLNLAYGIDEFRRNRSLPSPYPVKDYGCGRVWPAEDYESGHVASPIGSHVNQYYRFYPSGIHASVNRWCKSGNESYARDASVALARWAYAFPALVSQNISLGNMLAARGASGQEQRFHKRHTNSKFYHWYTQYAKAELDDYDRLYPYIADNWEVAMRVNEFVPWVKTPRDVIKLIDTHLVQHTVKRILRYYWHTGEMKPAKLASVMGDNEFTDPWMQFLFTRTFVYPMPVSGLPDLMVTACTREGTEYVASTAYGGGENALPKAAALVDYLEAGGNQKYNLADPERYPKPLEACYWIMERHLAGLNYLRIGDVTGPDKYYGGQAETLNRAGYWGWKWSRDPVFAWLLVHNNHRKDFTDGEWGEIREAAKEVERAPWLDLPSRALPMWAAILESGRQHDDRLFRRALMLRAGMGWGHHHNDGLDLQVYAHGTMMTCDGGQRPGYSKPADRSTRMHNLVEVDGLGDRDGEWYGYNWIRTLTDAGSAKYTQLEAVPPENHENVDLYARQTALLDVDEGRGARDIYPRTDEKQGEGDTPVIGRDIVTANSYVFDVCRVSGGKRHSYNFHGNLSAAVTHNLENAVPIEKAPDKDQLYVRRMAGEKLAGDAPDHLQLTWRLQQKQVARDLPREMRGDIPPYFTRLHILGEKDARVLRGALDCTKFGYQIPMAFVQRRGDDEDDPEAEGNLQSAFAAIIEPYVAEVFIADINEIKIPDNEADARRAVALEVLTKNGHRDICFADGRPDKERTVGKAVMAGEFGYISTDGEGLRRAQLTGGTVLQADNVLLRPTVREYTGEVTKVDYAKRLIWTDGDWPELSGKQSVFEVGIRNHWTSYTATDILPMEKGSVITVKRGADLYLSRVKEIEKESNTVICSLGFPYADGRILPGLDRDWVASNGDQTRWWRAEYQSGNIGLARFRFKLTGEPATMSDFGRTREFRLWEYGPGDSLRHRTFASLLRVEPGVYLLEADVDVTVGLRGGKLETSPDGKEWKPVSSEARNGLAVAVVPLASLSEANRLYLRVK